MSTLVPFAKAAIAIAIAVGGYVGACVLLYMFQARFLFPGAFMPLAPAIEAEGRAPAPLIRAPLTFGAIGGVGHAEGLFGAAMQERIAPFLATISP